MNEPVRSIARELRLLSEDRDGPPRLWALRTMHQLREVLDRSYFDHAWQLERGDLVQVLALDGVATLVVVTARPASSRDIGIVMAHVTPPQPAGREEPLSVA
jgi:hypothetical protein